MPLTEEQINQKLAEARARVADPNYEPLTLEKIKAQLESGEITKKRYDYLDRLHGFSPEAKEYKRRRYEEGRYKINPENLTRWK